MKLHFIILSIFLNLLSNNIQAESNQKLICSSYIKQKNACLLKENDQKFHYFKKNNIGKLYQSNNQYLFIVVSPLDFMKSVYPDTKKVNYTHIDDGNYIYLLITKIS